MAETIDHYVLERSKDQKTSWQTVDADATSPLDDPHPDGNPANAQGNTVFYKVTGITTPSALEVPYDIGHLTLNAPGAVLSFSHFGNDANDDTSGLASVTNGDVWVSGLKGNANGCDFGNGVSIEGLSRGIYIARYNSAGLAQYARNLSGVSTEGGQGVVIRSHTDGSLIFAGHWGGSLDFGEGAVSHPSGAGATDIYVVKRTSANVRAWEAKFGGTGPELLVDAQIDNNGDVWFAGYIDVQSSIDVMIGSYNLGKSAGFFIAKLSGADGSVLFASRINAVIHELAIDRAANPNTLIICGTSTANLGSGTLNGLFVARYSSAGAHQLSRSFGGTGASSIRVAVDRLGRIGLGGVFQGSLTFGSTVLHEDQFGFECPWGAHLTSGFGEIWARRFGSNANRSYMSHVAFDNGSQQKLIFFGRTISSINFGGSELKNNSNVVFIGACQTVNNAYQYAWSAGINAFYQVMARGLSVDSSNNVWVTTEFSRDIQWNGGSYETPGLGERTQTDIALFHIAG